MAAPIEVSYHQFDPPEHVREKIETLLGQLEKYEDDIIDGRVVVEGSQRQGQKTVLDVHVEVDVKGRRLVGKRSAEYPAPAGQKSFSKAATEAFRVVQRQIKEQKDRLAHETTQLDHQHVRGRVGSLDRAERTGFVEMPGGTSLFFSEAVLKNTDFEALTDGDTVIVTEAEAESPYGPQASSVELESPNVRSR